MRLERSIDASPEVVFDAFTDPALQKELHGAAEPKPPARGSIVVGAGTGALASLRGTVEI